MLKKLLLNAIKNDRSFALDMFSALFESKVFSLQKDNYYLLVVSDPLSDGEVENLTKSLPAGSNLAVMSSKTATLIELKDLT